MNIVKLVSLTPDAEETIAYIARVSNPKNQDNEKYDKLLKYMIDHGHWSPFEQAYMTIEIQTSLAIATQILRHRSFTFQQFSQRYAEKNLINESIDLPELRRQDTKNRQNSIDDIAQDIKDEFNKRIRKHFDDSTKLYDDLLNEGVAKESARFVLPQATTTRMYMTGTIRSWMHYIDLRAGHGTQKEHMDIANQIQIIFKENMPVIALTMNW
jgi:thymidylate synthase (FAD)|tara:strand:- start:782 stop:1417 length:636 start_codon:yes stop_codon:yes gene_type:complete